MLHFYTLTIFVDTSIFKYEKKVEAKDPVNKIFPAFSEFHNTIKKFLANKQLLNITETLLKENRFFSANHVSVICDSVKNLSAQDKKLEIFLIPFKPL